MITTILVILALCKAPGVNWTAAGLLCLALAHLIGSGLLT